MKLIKVELLPNAGNVKAKVHAETPDGKAFHCLIVKQAGHRAYLDTQGATITHKQKRILQREAVTLWADMIGDTFEGLLESERVFKGSRFKQLGVQLKIFCLVCDRNTFSEFVPQEGKPTRNQCAICGTLRKGKPYIGKLEMERITEKLNACKGTGVDYGQQRMD